MFDMLDFTHTNGESNSAILALCGGEHMVYSILALSVGEHMVSSLLGSVRAWYGTTDAKARVWSKPKPPSLPVVPSHAYAEMRR